MANAVCHNAGEKYDQDGVCKATTCTKGPPGQQYTYDCVLCELPAAGTAGATGTAGAVGTTAGAAATGTAGASTTGTAGATGGGVAGGAPVTDDDSGCSVGALGSEKGIATLMLGLGFIALGIARRRR